MLEVVLVLGGIFVGFFIANRLIKKPVGCLFFYSAEPGEPPVMAAELNQPVENIYNCDYVVFKVSRR